MYEVSAIMTPPPRSSSKPAWAVALKKRREEVVGSQEDLAAQADMSQSLVSQMERGVQSPTGLSVERFMRLLMALSWDFEQFQEATNLLDEDSKEFMLAARRARNEFVHQVKPKAVPDGLKEAIQIYGKRYEDLRNPLWQNYLAGFRWRDGGQPEEPERWLDLYRDLIRAGVEPGTN